MSYLANIHTLIKRRVWNVLGYCLAYMAVVLPVIVLLQKLGMGSPVVLVVIPLSVWLLVRRPLLRRMGLLRPVEGVVAKIAITWMFRIRDWHVGDIYDGSYLPEGRYGGRYMTRLVMLGPLQVLTYNAPRAALQVFHQADLNIDAERQVAPYTGHKLHLVALVVRRGTDIASPQTGTLVVFGERLQVQRSRALRLRNWLVQAEQYRGQP